MHGGEEEELEDEIENEVVNGSVDWSSSVTVKN
jgi:hypothetical protein